MMNVCINSPYKEQENSSGVVKTLLKKESVVRSSSGPSLQVSKLQGIPIILKAEK